MLPWGSFTGWAAGVRAPGACAADDAALAAALEHDRRLLRERLRATCADAQVAAALRSASPSLVEHGLGRPSGDRSKRAQSAEHSLVRYVTRMATRPTPFGTLASYMVGGFADRAELQFAPRAALRVRARLDLGVLTALVDAAAEQARDDDALLLRANPSLYRVAGAVRVPARVTSDGQIRRRLLSLRSTPLLEEVLEAAAGEVAAGALVALLHSRSVSGERARGFVAMLVDRQVLIPARALSVTGGDPTAQARTVLDALPGAGAFASALCDAAAEVDAAVANGDLDFAKASARLESLAVPLPSRGQVQVDSVRPGSARLPGVVLRELRRAVELLDRIATPVEDPVLKAFREDFVRRYETREVPLAEALDPDSGLPLRDDWSSRQPRATARARTLVLLELAERGRATGEVELTDEDVARLEHAQRVPLPDAFVVTATLLARDAGALDAGDFMVAGPSVIGPSGARLLGRLCDGDDELAAHVLRHLRQEEGLQPGVAFAELATVPDTAWALSVSHRPVLRDWEVECGGTSGADPSRRLPLEDLLVSVDGEEIVLRSSRLGRRVEVRATTAVNTDWVPFPAARFLRRLEGRGHDPTREWSWGPLHDAPHLPRVRHGRIVVAPRRWYLRGPEVAATDGARFRQVQAWRHAHDLPRVVSFDAAKAPVVVDFDNALSVEAFLTWSRRVERLRLVEVAPEEQCPVTGEDGRYAHDLVVPFTCEVQPPRRAPRAAARAVIEDGTRRLPPGSDWLYAKLYGPATAVDAVLQSLVRPLAARLTEAAAIDRWFFVRYADPDPHVRLRLHGAPDGLLAEALPDLLQAAAAALEAGLINRIALDTYEREVERYGGSEGVALMEQAAHADSEAAVVLLATGPGEALRRHLAAASVAALYADAELELGLCRDLSAEQVRTLVLRTGAGAADLADGQRAERPAVEALLTSLDDPAAPPAVAALRRRSTTLRPVLTALRELDREGRLGRDLPGIVATLGHLQVNRLLKQSGGVAELRVHDALARFYRGVLARRRGT